MILPLGTSPSSHVAVIDAILTLQPATAALALVKRDQQTCSINANGTTFTCPEDFYCITSTTCASNDGDSNYNNGNDGGYYWWGAGVGGVVIAIVIILVIMWCRRQNNGTLGAARGLKMSNRGAGRAMFWQAGPAVPVPAPGPMPILPPPTAYTGQGDARDVYAAESYRYSASAAQLPMYAPPTNGHPILNDEKNQG